MISARLVELIQNHAPRLTADIVSDLMSNPHTRGFQSVPRLELEARIFRVYDHLGDWIAARQLTITPRLPLGPSVPLSASLLGLLVAALSLGLAISVGMRRVVA